MIKARYNNPNLKVVMIGDGATDLEASPPATHFIGKERTVEGDPEIDCRYFPSRLRWQYRPARGAKQGHLLYHGLPGADGTD